MEDEPVLGVFVPGFERQEPSQKAVKQPMFGKLDHLSFLQLLRIR
jgi:hypothetical protein